MGRSALTGATRKILRGRLQAAYADHATRLIRRIHALLGLADGKSVFEMAQLLGVGEPTVRDWLPALILRGVEGLFSRPRSGRPPKRTARQRRELGDLLDAGPEAAG
jgi:transposase